MADQEISANAKAFRESLEGRFAANLGAIAGHSTQKLDDSYARLTTLQGWKTFVLDQRLSKESLGFFSEAQNDGLTSCALMAVGLWRPAMKSLRSLIENLLHCLYFADHPVEYRLWDDGKYRPPFKELFDYFLAHPDIGKLPDALNGAIGLKLHYKHLSNVVHASAREFRMTSSIESLKLWNTSADGTGKWSDTQKNVMRDANLLMMALFHTSVEGAAQKGLRESLALVLPSTKDAMVKAHLNITVVRS